MGADLKIALTAFLEATKQQTVPQESEFVRLAESLQGPTGKQIRGLLKTFGYEAILAHYQPPIPSAGGNWQAPAHKSQSLHNHPSQLGATLEERLKSFPSHPTTPDKVVKWLSQNGFTHKKSNSGSHAQWAGPSGHKVTVPMHNKDLAPGTLRSIKDQAIAGLVG